MGNIPCSSWICMLGMPPLRHPSCACVCVSLFQCEIQALQCKFQSSIFCHIQVLAVKNSSDLVQSMPLSWSNNTTINICSF